jgi:hypothetical protein
LNQAKEGEIRRVSKVVWKLGDRTGFQYCKMSNQAKPFYPLFAVPENSLEIHHKSILASPHIFTNLHTVKKQHLFRLLLMKLHVFDR